MDVSPDFFYHSGRHAFKWLGVDSRTFAVIADENWASTTPVEARCHYCPSPFEYRAYQWNAGKATFELFVRLHGQKSYSEAQEALDGDWAFIRGGIEALKAKR